VSNILAENFVEVRLFNSGSFTERKRVLRFDDVRDAARFMTDIEFAYTEWERERGLVEDLDVEEILATL